MVVIVMFSTMADITSFTVAPSSIPEIERTLTRMAKDAINVLNDLPARTGAPCGVHTKMEELVHEGVKGEHELWDAWKDARVPPGIGAELVLTNGDGLMSLQGESIQGSTADVNWQPDQTYSLPTTNVDAVSGTESMIVSAPLVAWGSQARIQGEALRIEATIDSLADNTPLTHAPTAILDSAIETQARQGAANITWVHEGIRDLTRGAFTENVQLIDPQVMEFKLLVEPLARPDGSPGVIPVGTSLTVEFPRGWTQIEFSGAMGSWVDETDPASPLRLRAIVRDSPSAARTFELSAFAPPEPAHPFDVVKASLGRGSLGESTLSVTYPVATTERALPRTLHPTTPYPLRSGSWGLFGAVLTNGGDETIVKRMEWRVVGEYDLDHNDGKGSPMFTSELDPVEPATGWSVEEDGRVLVWTSANGITIQPGTAAYWMVGGRVTGDPTHATSVESPSSDGPNATFTFENGFEVASRSWGKTPGIPVVRVPPASRAVDDPSGGTNDGYPWSAAGQSFDVSTVSRSPMTMLTNTTAYTTKVASADLANLDTAVASAAFEVTTRAARVGSLVEAEGDFSNAVTMLAEAGVTPTIQLDLYAPPTLGCEPTVRWEISTASLPTAGTNALILWDQGGATSAFAATDDGYLHRLDLVGTPIWSEQTEGTAVALLAIDSPTWGSHLIVGTSSGSVQRFDPLLGEVTWTHDMGTASVGLLRFDEARGRILAASQTGALQAIDTDGVVGDPTSVGASPTDVVATQDHVFVLDSTALHKFEPDLRTASAYQTANALGFALTTTEIWVASALKVDRVDRDTLAKISQETFEIEAAIATHGDATGDGIEDLAIAHADSRIRVISGADYEDVQILTPSNLLEFYGQEDSIDELVGLLPGNVPGMLDDSCLPPSPFAHYTTTVICGGYSGTGPVLLVAAEGSVAIVYENYYDTYLEQFDEDGTRIQSRMLDGTATPTALDIGPWTLTERAVGFGDSAGLVAVSVEDSPSMESTPGTRIGRFKFLMNVPEGGFYGTNVLVARLQWDTAGSEEARLVDWFEVLDTRGKEHENPAYRVAFTFTDMADPATLWREG